MSTLNRKKNLIQTYALVVIDIVCILVAYSVAFQLRYKGTYHMGQTHYLVCLFLIVLSLIFSFLLDWNHFIFKRGYFDEFLAVLKYIAIMVVMLGFVVFAFKWGEIFSRYVFGAFTVINGVLTYVSHIIFKKFLWTVYRKSASSDKVVVITYEKYVHQILDGIKSEGEWSYEVIGLVLLDEVIDSKQVENIPVVASGRDYKNVLQQQVMDAAFLYAPRMDDDEKNDIIDTLETMGVACYMSLGHKMKSQNVGSFAGHTVVIYESNYVDYRRRLIKRFFDIVGAVVGLVIVLITYPFIALAIKLDSPGPVIFKQQRIGRNGRRFSMYKYRSMYIDAEERKAELMQQNEVDGLMFKMENDPRITKVGGFIRRTSIDELPQFINVLMGDMSLVGTRPPTVEEFEQYSAHYRRRLSITPGLTGMWQVSGRSDIKDFDKVVELDLEYIDNWTLTLDMKILIQTIKVVFKREGSK